MPYFAPALLRKFAPRSLLISALCFGFGISAASHADSNVRDLPKGRQITERKTASKKTQKKAEKKVKAAAPDDSEFVNFAQWKDVSAFIDDMVARDGFDRAELNKMFSKTQYVDTAIKLMRPAPPGRPKNWTAYRLRFVDPVRINGGMQFWNQYEKELTRAEIEYGVPAEIIVAIIGVETIYGSNTGNFRVMDTLTTLAFDYPDTPTRDARMQFFRGELESLLLFARESHIDPFSLQGSYAGAIGLPQFMPSSIRQYAVDFDGKGNIDLRNSPVDAIGSVAHFLSAHGWRRGLPLVYSIPIGDTATDAQTVQSMLAKGLEATYSLDEIQALGLTPNIDPDAAGLKFGLIDLQNANGPTEYWLGSDNFFAITKYNRSFFYAMSVVDLSREIRAAHAH